MAANNPYLIPKIEEVRYLNSEVPSYEEFLRNYYKPNEGIELPETYTISYFDSETGQSFTAEEWKQLHPAVNPSEIRIINQGEVYRSWKADVDYPPYGPGFWEDLVPFVGKIALATVASGAVIATAGTAAPLVGAGMWVGGKLAEEAGKETDNQFLRSIGSFTKDVGFGSMTTLALKDAKFISDCASIGIDMNKLVKIKDLGQPMLAIKKHKEHRDRGWSYDRDCEVCNL